MEEQAQQNRQNNSLFSVKSKWVQLCREMYAQESVYVLVNGDSERH